MRTSYGDRTSPVLRGAWVLERLYGTPATPPPPGVETNLDNTPGGKPRTVRARLEQHRAAQACNTCHGVIDPIGLAMENFDVTGTWRARDESADEAIDASTTLPSGVPITGPVELRQQILARPEQFVQALTSKLLMYALGREVEFIDMPQVRAIVRTAAADDYRFSSLILGIVKSDASAVQGLPHERVGACPDFHRRQSSGGPPKYVEPRGSDMHFIHKTHFAPRHAERSWRCGGIPLLDAMIPAGHGARADLGHAEAASRLFLPAATARSGQHSLRQEGMPGRHQPGADFKLTRSWSRSRSTNAISPRSRTSRTWRAQFGPYLNPATWLSAVRPTRGHRCEHGDHTRSGDCRKDRAGNRAAVTGALGRDDCAAGRVRCGAGGVLQLHAGLSEPQSPLRGSSILARYSVQLFGEGTPPPNARRCCASPKASST